MQTPLLIAVTGPTGIGKSDLCIDIARRYNCPILNCDSRQIYRELPIGTAAPTALQLQLVKHFFVGTHNLEDSYNAGQYEQDATNIIYSLISEQTNPVAILAGGSMMYMDAVLYGLDEIPKADCHIRSQLQKGYEQNGISWLQEQAQTLDPVYYKTMADPKNPQRLIHCIEISKTTGKPYSSFLKKEKVKRPWKTLKFALNMPRDILYERINKRVDDMVQNGMEEEARKAYNKVKNIHPLPNSMCTVGYKEWIQHFEGKITYDETVSLIKQNTRHFAKRQLTWLRRQNDIIWIDKNNNDNAINNITRCIENFQ